MKKIHSFSAVLAMLFAGATAQTNPTAVTLPFALNSVSTTTPPGGVAVHKFSSIQTSRTLSPATGDLPNQGSSAAGTAGGWYDLGTDGIGLLASGTNAAGAVVVAINTSGLSNISVSWICKTIKNQASRDNSIALQYRVGTTGNFIDVGTTSTYSSTGTADGNTSTIFTETLPAGASNQSVVQVRWIYWESVSTSGSRDKISVDDISISSITSTTSACNTPTALAVPGVGTSSAGLSWSAVSGASSYEYTVTTSATPPVSGASTTGTTATVTGLSASTPYYFYVRAICTGTSTSGWASNTFTTQADTTAADTGEFVVMTYNLLNYPGSDGATRDSSFRRTMNDVQPDILVVQELATTASIGTFLANVLNFSTSNYSQGTFINGPDSDNGLYYKSSKFQFISNTPIRTDLRDINQFMLKHIASGDTLIIFSAHLKADNTSPDVAQRALEVDSLRKVTDGFPAGRYFMVCGDFNIYGSAESPYQKLVGTGNNTNGKFNDIISMTGTWNNSAYAINHTQSPRTTAFGGGATGGLDDRFDMFLFSDAIISSGGFDVVGGSYKAYGNDGLHYNQALNTAPYGMYSPAAAAALHNSSDHLPVVVKLHVSSGSPRTSATTGISNVSASDNKVSVYPNPANSTVMVKLNAAIDTHARFYLSDVNGKIIKQNALSGNEGETLGFDVSGLVPGVYFYRIVSQTGREVASGKLAIERN